MHQRRVKHNGNQFVPVDGILIWFILPAAIVRTACSSHQDTTNRTEHAKPARTHNMSWTSNLDSFNNKGQSYCTKTQTRWNAKEKNQSTANKRKKVISPTTSLLNYTVTFVYIMQTFDAHREMCNNVHDLAHFLNFTWTHKRQHETHKTKMQCSSPWDSISKQEKTFKLCHWDALRVFYVRKFWMVLCAFFLLLLLFISSLDQCGAAYILNALDVICVLSFSCMETQCTCNAILTTIFCRRSKVFVRCN